jgi:hypothetical protein
MRTQFGKITNTASQSGKGTNEDLTLRDIWVKDTFAFLSVHIRRQATRSSAKVGVKFMNYFLM